MTVDRLSLQPAIGRVTLLRTALCSRRRVALFVVVASALLAALLLYAGQLVSLRTIGPLLSKLPSRRPQLAARLSLSLVGDHTANTMVAAAASNKAGEKLQAMATAGQSTVAIALLDDGRTVAVRSTTAPIAELTSLAALLATYSATGKRDEFAAEATAVTAATVHTTTPGSTSALSATRPTVYVRFIDPLAGIGNKMFQYASGVGLALRHGADARLVLDHPEVSSKLTAMRRVFRMSPLPEQPAVPSAADAVTLAESGWGRYDAARFDNRSSFEHGANVIGYLQSWRYFEPVVSRIRSEFALSPLAASLADNFLRRSDNGGRAAEGNGTSNLFVGVHVRRGDMVSRPELYTVAPPEFLLNAMNHYVAKYGFANQLTFVIATNDRDWVKSFVETRLPKHIRVLHLQFTPEEDMAVLSRCNHSIVTVGTFGWWASWLAGGDVVYYKDFIRPQSPLYAGHVPSDYYPPHWLGMS